MAVASAILGQQVFRTKMSQTSRQTKNVASKPGVTGPRKRTTNVSRKPVIKRSKIQPSVQTVYTSGPKPKRKSPMAAVVVSNVHAEDFRGVQTRKVSGKQILPTVPNKRMYNQNLTAASPKRHNMGDNVAKRLKTKAPWYQALNDPKHGEGCKIPDAVGTETATVQIVTEVPVTVNAGGVSGCRVRFPFPNSTGGGLNAYNYQVTDPTATAAAIIWSDGVLPANNPPGKVFQQNAVMVTNSIGSRIVSASVTAIPEISSLSNSGEMCAYVFPWSGVERRFASPLTYASYTTLQDSSTLPVNQMKPLAARWYPVSMGDAEAGGLDYHDFIVPGAIPPQAQGVAVTPEWQFGVICSGMTASVGTVKFEIVINFEYLVLLNIMDLVDVGPSRVDEFEEQFTLKCISEEPVTGVVPLSHIGAAPSPVIDVPDPTGFGFLANIIKEVAPLAISLF